MKKNIYLTNLLFLCFSVMINAQNRKLDYLGGDLSCLHRIELIPGRTFQDINGTTVDPISHMAGKGFNAIRVFVSSDMPLTNPAGFPDNTNADQRELNYLLDFGGISEQVNLALRAKSAGMKVILTLQFGQSFLANSWHENIPKAWLTLTYNQTLTQLDTETRRMLTPFLDAGIQPDIIIVENEADSGMLYEVDNGSGSQAIRNNLTTDVFSDVATGIYTIWPKCAGYFKRVILSAKAVLTEKGKDNAYTRFAVHTTTNSARVSSTYDRIFNQPDLNETNYVVGGVDKGVVSIIPAEIRNTKLKDLVDIMGASVYPGVPASASTADITTSLKQFNTDWTNVGSKITSFGKWTTGPYIGQYKKQGLVVEYALGSVTEPVRIAAVKEFLNEVCNNYPWIIGAMWWEPEYANNNWYGSTAELYNKVAWNPTFQTWPVFKETTTLAVWGSYAATSTAINETFDGSSIKVYPNPLHGQRLSVDGLTGNSTISLIDVSGNILKNYQISGNILNLDVNLQPGIFFVKIKDSTKTTVKKLLVN
jgi:hypothetical protein